MKSFILTTAFILTSVTSISASVIPRDNSQCCFELYAHSATLNGTVEEDTIGENRVLGAYPDGNYCVSSSFSGLHDINGHTCLIDPGSQRFECYAAGIVSNTSFTIADNSHLMHDGSADWLACPSTSQVPDGSFYLYSNQKANSKGCVTVQLLSAGCSALGRPSSSSSLVTSTSASATQSIPVQSNSFSVEPFTSAGYVSASTVPSASTTASPSATSFSTVVGAPATSASASCPTGLFSDHLVPHLIVPVASGSSNTSYGTVYSPSINPTNSTLYAFDIPSTASYAGTCALLFLFPYGDEAVYTYTFTGTEEEEGENGGLDFARLSGSISTATTFASKPAVATEFGKTEIIPGNNYTIATFPCPSGGQMAVKASSVGNVGLTYFQDDQPSPIGLYVVPCA